MKKTISVIILCLALLASKYLDVKPVETLRLKVFDFYQEFKPRSQTSDSVVLIEITEQDLKRYGQWPWPRDVLAKLHNKISNLGAKQLQYNIIFSEFDRLNELQKLKGNVSNDTAFANELSKVPTVLMYSVKNEATTSPAAKAPVRIEGYQPDQYLYTFKGIVSNIVPLLQNAKGAGVNIVIPNLDGTVRQVPLLVYVNQLGIMPNQILDTLRVVDNSKMFKVTTNDSGITNVQTSRHRKMHTDENAMLYVNFANPKTIKKYSASDILLNRIVDIEGKIVIVGLRAAGLAYLKDTPLGLMTDAEISAQALETVFTKTQLIRNKHIENIELYALIVVGILLIVTVPRLGVTSSITGFILLLTAIIYASWEAYSKYYTMFDISFLVIFTTLIWGHLIYNNFAIQFRLRQQIKKQFEHYLAPDMVAKLQKNPSLLRLGGETRTMTFLFSDIRGFTPISEKYKGNPKGLTKLINRFLTRMTDIIIANGGTIDKFMGDCIMAFWNAPLDVKDHAGRAVKSAIEMQKELKVLNAELKKEKLPTINIGIGINTGEALVGNMGSEQRFDYSVIGDDVNLASRLESSSKELDAVIVIGEKTKKQAKGYKYKSLGGIMVKGKSEKIKVYTI